MAARWYMLLRVVGASLRARPGKLLLSLTALTAGATLASAFLSLYFELPRQISGEFRTFGPNLILAPRDNGQTVPAALERGIAEAFPELPSLPWLYAVGQAESQPVILAGTDLGRIAAIHPSWTGLPPQALPDNGVLAGETVATLLKWKPGATVTVRYESNEASLLLAGIVSTGGSEDSQVLLPLTKLQSLTGKTGGLSLIQIAAPGSAAQVDGTLQRMRAHLAAQSSEVELRPLRPVLESEALVVMKVRWLMFGLAAVVLTLVMLSVLTTVSGRILDRRRDIGVMKALGGSDRGIGRFFLAESAAQGLLAGMLGYGVGYLLAQWAAQRMFHSTVAWRWDVVATVLVVTLGAALAATVLPARRIHRMEAAVILRGE